MQFYFQLCLLFLSGSCLAQNPKPVPIRQVQITDTVLINNINYLVKEKSQSSGTYDLFTKNTGYVKVYIESLSNSGDTLREYYIDVGVNSIEAGSPDLVYPDCYAYIGKRLVLIHLNIMEQVVNNRLPKKSKKKLRELVENTLPDAPTVVLPFENENGKKVKDKDFRPYVMMLHSGLKVIVLQNGQVLRAPDMNF